MPGSLGFCSNSGAVPGAWVPELGGCLKIPVTSQVRSFIFVVCVCRFGFQRALGAPRVFPISVNHGGRWVLWGNVADDRGYWVKNFDLV